MKREPEILLASGSAIRARILRSAGVSFSAVAPLLMEEPSPVPSESAASYVSRTATEKAGSVGANPRVVEKLQRWSAYCRAHPDKSFTPITNSQILDNEEARLPQSFRHFSLPPALVVASDQVVELDGKILRKVREGRRFEAAYQRLKSFVGRDHYLVGAISAWFNGEEVFRSHSRVRVRLRNVDDYEIADYLNLEQPWSSVACYFLEGRGIQLIEEIEGDYLAALGLDFLSLNAFFQEWRRENQGD